MKTHSLYKTSAPSAHPKSNHVQYSSILENLKHDKDWKSKDYREGFVEGVVSQSLLLQLNANLKHRRMSANTLANKAGVHLELVKNAINGDIEDMTMGQFLKLVNALDIAVVIDLVDHASLLLKNRESADKPTYAVSFKNLIKNSKTLSEK